MPMTPEEQKIFDDNKAALEALKKENEDLKKKPTPPADKKDDEEGEGGEEGDLSDKAKAKAKADGDQKETVKRIENATRFTLGIEKYLEDNKDFLPAEISEIVKLAEKENYDSVQEKANATKAGIIKSFFQVQSHLDLLTPSQKKSLDDFLKLTKNGREEKAPDIYENIFEPVLESLKRVKKAEEVGRANAGFSTDSGVMAGYKERLIKGSRLGSKEKN